MESLSQKRYRQKPEVKERNRIYQREWAKKNRDPLKVRNTNLKKNHGVSLAKFDRMFDEQGGKCAICKTPFESRDGRGIHVDHDHKTGMIRDLLCNCCNVMIGQAKEDEETLRNAIEYIEKWNQKRQQMVMPL